MPEPLPADAWSRCLETQLPAGVAVGFLDVDGLLAVNEGSGRTAGDRILARVADGLGAWAATQPPAPWCRLHGDEYAFALPGAALEEAFLAAEALRARLDATLATEAVGRCSISVGVAQAPRDAADVPALLRAAETACRLAKEAGGGRVGLPVKEEMVLKSCYYPATAVRRLRLLAERSRRKESGLLREAVERLLVRRLRLLAERSRRKQSDLFREALERLLAAHDAQ